MTEKLIIGIIGAPFGVKGFVKVRSASGETDHLLKLQSVIVKKDGSEQRLQIAESSCAAKTAAKSDTGNYAPVVLMRFKGIETPEAAKKLNGAQLLAGRDQTAPLGAGEYYIEDLKGLPVLSEDGELIGHITDIIEGGGGELAEIKRLTLTEYDYDIKCLVPFRKEFFSVIDLENGGLVLNFRGLELIPGWRHESLIS